MVVKINKHKVALVGPVYPYRGGIAQYNTMLHNELSKKHELKSVSFSKLYPKFLYPGKGVIEERDQGNKHQGVEYLISVYKPWTLAKAARSIRQFGAEIVFINWWTVYWQPGLALLALLLRKKGVKVVYICHNIYDHDSSGMKEILSKTLIRYVDGYVVHSVPDKEKLLQLTNKPIYNSKVLPVYNLHSGFQTKIKKRGRLELLFFGFIRPYKGLDDIIQALDILKDDEVYLTIVGESWINQNELNEKIEKMPYLNIETRFEYVDDTEAAYYFDRADVIVLPYKAPAASAVASLAYNHRKPILATRVDGIKDVVNDGTTGWLIDANSPESIAKALKKISRKDAQIMAGAIKKFCENHSWSRLADGIVAFSDRITR